MSPSHPEKQNKGYKSSYDEDGAENVILEGEQSQTHVGEDEIFSQEVKGLKELRGGEKQEKSVGTYEHTTRTGAKTRLGSVSSTPRRFNEALQELFVPVPTAPAARVHAPLSGACRDTDAKCVALCVI